MPELPEIETTRLGLLPLIKGQTVERLVLHRNRLRYDIPSELAQRIAGKKILDIKRRAKYLLFEFDQGVMLSHLGMSGVWRWIDHLDSPLQKHDHVELLFKHSVARYNDPRRFGCLLWVEQAQLTTHPVLINLGVEPLSNDFSAQILHQYVQQKNGSIKQLLLSGHCVVGVGNIYACESLFLAGILPTRPAASLSLAECDALVIAIVHVLKKAIAAGGSSISDFKNVNGQSGYFQNEYHVYQRAGEHCLHCTQLIFKQKQQQRSSFFCLNCQV
jgi:formamidopyrimidine-DNA glycosylase